MTDWRPVYTISSKAAKALMEIEAAKAVVANTHLPPAVQEELRHYARIRSTHYSTRIEGNRLTLKQAREVVEKKKAGFRGRERDVREVKNYWDALKLVEDLAARQSRLTEDLIRRLHAVVEKGRKAKPTPYRGGQNVVRDSSSGRIVYMPPEAKDVPKLMAALARWADRAKRSGVPAPIVAALVHYQFVTIHPYYDGNGRTARLLATFILRREGYGLSGFLSVEEHHAQDLEGYYRMLATHPHHNYYMGRAEANLTVWIDYFTGLLAKVFTGVKNETLRRAGRNFTAEPKKLRQLDPRARTVIALFAAKDRITGRDVASSLGLSDRMVRVLLAEWTKNGWLRVVDPSNRNRAYGLSAIYRQFIGNVRGG